MLKVFNKFHYRHTRNDSYGTVVIVNYMAMEVYVFQLKKIHHKIEFVSAEYTNLILLHIYEGFRIK